MTPETNTLVIAVCQAFNIKGCRDLNAQDLTDTVKAAYKEKFPIDASSAEINTAIQKAIQNGYIAKSTEGNYTITGAGTTVAINDQRKTPAFTPA